jgi:hypothetical protein
MIKILGLKTSVPSSLLIACLVGACSSPHTSVNVLDEKPHLQFTGAPPDADVIIDGRIIGKAQDFDGRKQDLSIVSGTHHIVVRTTSRVLYASDVYLSKDMTKTISIPE